MKNLPGSCVESEEYSSQNKFWQNKGVKSILQKNNQS